MKKFLVLAMVVCLSFNLIACSGGKTQDTTSDNSDKTTVEEQSNSEEQNATEEQTNSEEQNATETQTNSEVEEQEPVKEEEVVEEKSMSLTEFKELIASQPINVTSTEYAIQSDDFKSLYPDMLQAVVKNNTEIDIKSSVIAFVAWDENKLPVKLQGDIDFNEPTYLKQVNFTDMNLIGGATYGESSGYGLAEGLNIDTFEAIVVSCSTFDGTEWVNPYYDEFKEVFEGKKYQADTMVEVTIENVDLVAENEIETVSDEELKKSLANEPMTVESKKYVVQSEDSKSLYPDMLQVTIKNNTESDIKDAVVAFAAWDENGLPVRIRGYMDYDDPTYISEVMYSDINLIGGAVYGEGRGLSLDENLGIKKFEAMVVSYETFEGEKWENPNYELFQELYEDKKNK